ncbi:unnamed protein product, partial [marine sediment metagenome]
VVQPGRESLPVKSENFFNVKSLKDIKRYGDNPENCSYCKKERQPLQNTAGETFNL